MVNIKETLNYTNWTELVSKLRENQNEFNIYRGHSNDYRINVKQNFFDWVKNGVLDSEINLIHWPLISSFDRLYTRMYYKFDTFLTQQFEDNNFKARYRSHKLKEISDLISCNILERLYFFQHYGIPTCFLDFSHNPLVALFFSITSVRATNSYNVDSNGNPLIHLNGPYISIYEFNYQRISALLNIKSIENDFSGFNYNSYSKDNFHLAFDMNPLEKCHSPVLNKNLKFQEGCFILFDNNGGNKTLDQFIQDQLSNSLLNEILIREYRLTFNGVFHRYDFEGLRDVTLFDFLDYKNVTGRTLFSDIQGLKYDLNFYHH